jgi:hypothetical protein
VSDSTLALIHLAAYINLRQDVRVGLTPSLHPLQLFAELLHLAASFNDLIQFVL